MTRFFAPGCGLMLYKPHLAGKLQQFLHAELGPVERMASCCRNIPPLPAGAEVINICPGCDRRYRENYADATTVSLWEVLAKSSRFPFPDHQGREMTILDACPTRDQARVHDAVRTLLKKMNVALTEPKATRERGTCCGDSLWGSVPDTQVIAQMKKRAAVMPCEEVVVYCVSCIKAMANGGRRPRYLVDLLCGEETDPQTSDPAKWHAQLDEYIAQHK
jgi:Fe-S oxidoreductase